MSIENEIASLTQSTTGLLTAVNTKKAILDTAVTNAEAAATDSTAQAVTSTSAKNSSEAARDAAVVAKNAANTSALNAAAVVTGGTATIVPQAGKIPLADSEGIIDADWLPAEITGRNVFAEDQAKGNAKYAASGFVYMGKHYADSTNHKAINEGVWTAQANTNILRMGENEGLAKGESKSLNAVINLAGIETELVGLNSFSNSNLERCEIRFPEAPNGTVTYDSATGVITDYTTDVDPKYGDVASSTNEAVARAFEGEVKNGDFRFGDDSNWTPTGSASIDSNGLKIVMDGIDASGGANYNIQLPADTYKVTINVTTLTGDGITIAYAGGNVGEITTAGIHVFDVTTTTTANFNIVRWLGGLTEETDVLVRSISFASATEEVVTERVDMYGFEGFLEEVTTGNPYVYPNGLIQSQATTMDGVTTTGSNRPATYYAVFDGDTGSVGKGVNFNTATNANKVKMFSNPKNNLYWIEGSLYQWRVRQRTIAGAGNGDWDSIDSGKNNVIYQSIDRLFKAQGYKDSSAVSNGDWDNGVYWANDSQYNLDVNLGIYTAHQNGYIGHCYFLVCGTVPRLNQGAFHPSFNTMGTGVFRINTGGNGGHAWYSTTILKPVNAKDCFHAFNYNEAPDKAGKATPYGSISVGNSGRSDGKFYDAIYASGQGGVIDNRLSAWDKASPEEASKVDAMVKNGSYRGVEKLTRVEWLDEQVRKSGTTGWSASQDGELYMSQDTYSDSTTREYFADRDATHWLISGDNGKGMIIRRSKPTGGTDRVYFPYTDNYIHIYGTGGIDVSAEFESNFPSGTTLRIGIVYETNISVSGDFTQTDVIGDPANILLNPDLKDGWMGSWIPEIPSSTTKTFKLSRKYIENPSSIQKTDNNGDTWSDLTSNVNWAIMNARLNTMSAVTPGYWIDGVAAVLDYTAFAKQTKVANNEQVFNGEAGIGSVFFGGSNKVKKGNLLTESLAGFVAVGIGLRTDSVTLDNFTFNENGNLERSSWGWPTHGKTNVSGGDTIHLIKALNYQVEAKSQLGINYSFEELVHNNSDFGDSGAVHIANNTTTNTDDAGNTVLAGTGTLALPYGWSKNEV